MDYFNLICVYGKYIYPNVLKIHTCEFEKNMIGLSLERNEPNTVSANKVWINLCPKVWIKLCIHVFSSSWL